MALSMPTLNGVSNNLEGINQKRMKGISLHVND